MAIIDTKEVNNATVSNTNNNPHMHILNTLGVKDRYGVLDKDRITYLKEESGVKYVDVGITRSSGLGFALMPKYKLNIMLFNNNIGSISNLMDALSKKGYPAEYLANNDLTKEHVRNIKSMDRIIVPNYWAIVCYALIERINLSKSLKEDLYRNKLPIVCLKTVNSLSILGKDITNTNMLSINKQMDNYVAIIRCIERLIKKDAFNKDNIVRLVKLWVDYPDKDIMQGAPDYLK